MFMSNEIKLFRLYSGEELIANLSILENGNYMAKDITVIFPTQSNSLGLAPFMPYSKIAETGIEVRAKDILFITEPVVDLEARYREMHGMVMAPPAKRIIL